MGSPNTPHLRAEKKRFRQAMKARLDQLSVDEVNERMENLAANGIADVVDGLAGVAAGFESLGDLGKRLRERSWGRGWCAWRHAHADRSMLH